MAMTQTAERSRSLVRHLSGGYQRRVNIAAAILASPRLVVLDEPTVGVDLTAKEAIGEALMRLRAEGVGILLVTHDLDQAGQLADRVGILCDGVKALEGAPNTLIDEAFGDQMEIEVDANGAAASALLAAEGFHREPSGAWRRLAPNGYVLAAEIGERLRMEGALVREIRVRRPSLEQLFALVVEARLAA